MIKPSHYLLTIQYQHRHNGNTYIANEIITYSPEVWLSDRIASEEQW